jgi:hypothetical protein
MTEIDEKALRILNALTNSVPINVLIPRLRDLRTQFKKNGGPVLGCRTWKEFCERGLHKSDRTVRFLLQDGKITGVPEARPSATAVSIANWEALKARLATYFRSSATRLKEWAWC